MREPERHDTHHHASDNAAIRVSHGCATSHPSLSSCVTRSNKGVSEEFSPSVIDGGVVLSANTSTLEIAIQ